MNFTILIAATGRQLREQWVTYVVYEAHTTAAPVVIYVGHCQLERLFTLPDLRGNPSFDNDKPMMVVVDSVHPSKIIAGKRAAQLCVQHGQNLLNSTARIKHHYKVRCIQTGEVFNTAAQCAVAHGIAASALSNHLNHKVGYTTVGGRNYDYVK